MSLRTERRHEQGVLRKMLRKRPHTKGRENVVESKRVLREAEAEAEIEVAHAKEVIL